MRKIIKICAVLTMLSAVLTACQEQYPEASAAVSSIIEKSYAMFEESDAPETMVNLTDEATNKFMEELPGIIDSATGFVTSVVEHGTNKVDLNSITGQINELKDNIPTTQAAKNTQGFEEVQLVRVVDGDTLMIIGSDGLEYKVRLIGIDTPESVHSDASKNNEFGTRASDHTKKILENTDTLYLEYDKQVTDKYNRTLAYVWLTKDTDNILNMLNARILSEGYAVDKVFEPNHQYADQFATICHIAKDMNAGLWQYDEYKELVNR